MSVIRDSLKDVNVFLGDLFKRLTKKQDQYLSGELVFEVNVNAFLVLNAIFLTSSLPKSMRLRPEIVRQMGTIKDILVHLPKLSIFSDPGRLEKTRELNLGLYRSIIMLQLIRVKPSLIVDLADVSARLQTLKVVESVGSFDEVYDVPLSNSPTPADSGDDTTKRLIKSGCWGALRAVSFRGNFVAEMSPLLGSMRHVETLDLSENLIRRVRYLQGCICLTTLNLTNNSITDVAGIAQELGNVKTLILRHNRIRSTQGLEMLFGLEELDLAENAIDDIMQVSKLSALPILGSLWLEGNIIANRLAYRREVFSLFVKQFSADSTYSLCLDGLYPSEDEYKAIVDSAPLLYNPVISFSSRAIVRENSAGALSSAVTMSSSTLHKRVKSKRKSKLVDLGSQRQQQQQQQQHAVSSSQRHTKKKDVSSSHRPKESGGGPSSAPKVHRKLQNAASPSSSYDSTNDEGSTTGGSMNNYDAYADEEAGSDLAKSPLGFGDAAVAGYDDDIYDVEYNSGDNGSAGNSYAGIIKVRPRKGRRGSAKYAEEGEEEDEEEEEEYYESRESAASVPAESPTIAKSKEWLNKLEHIREQTGKRWLIAVNELMKQRQGEEDDDYNGENEKETPPKKEAEKTEEHKSVQKEGKTVIVREDEAPKPVVGSLPDDEIKKELAFGSAPPAYEGEGNPFVDESAKAQPGSPKPKQKAEPVDTTNPFLVSPASFKPSAAPTNPFSDQGALSLSSTSSSYSSSSASAQTNPFVTDTASPPSVNRLNASSVETTNPFLEPAQQQQQQPNDYNYRNSKRASAELSKNPFIDASTPPQQLKVGSLETTNPFLEQQQQYGHQAAYSLQPTNPFLEAKRGQARGSLNPKRASVEISDNQSRDMAALKRNSSSLSMYMQQQISSSPSITEPLYGITSYNYNYNNSNNFNNNKQTYQSSFHQHQPPSQSPTQNVTPPPSARQNVVRKDDAFNDTLNSMLRDDGGLEAWLQLKVFQEDVDEFFFLALECTMHRTGFPALIIIGTKRLYVVAAQSRERVKDPKEWMTRKVATFSLSLVGIRSVAVGPRYQYLRVEPAETSAAHSSSSLLFVTPVHEKAHIFVDALAQKVKSSYEMKDDYDPETTQIDFEVVHLARQTRANFTSNVIKSKKNRAPPPASICVYSLVQYGEKREPMTLIATPLRIFVCKDEFYRWPIPKAQFTKEREVIITDISSVSLDRCSLTINVDRESWVVFFPNKQELTLAVSVIEQLYYAKLRIPLVKED